MTVADWVGQEAAVTLPKQMGWLESKMVAPNIHRSSLKNRYGESWEFEYDPSTGEGVLRGTDVDLQEYRVFDGQVPDLILNDEEIRWLSTAWKEATGGN